MIRGRVCFVSFLLLNSLLRLSYSLTYTYHHSNKPSILITFIGHTFELQIAGRRLTNTTRFDEGLTYWWHFLVLFSALLILDSEWDLITAVSHSIIATTATTCLKPWDYLLRLSKYFSFPFRPTGIPPVARILKSNETAVMYSTWWVTLRRHWILIMW